MVSRVSEQGRSEEMPFASGRPISNPHYDSEPLFVSIHRDEHDLDGKPGVQELVISTEEGHTLLVKISSDGGLTLRDIRYTDLVSLYLPAAFADALIFQAYERICDKERWQYEQELAATLKAGPTQDQWTPPAAEGLPCCFDETPENPAIQQYLDGFLTLEEYDALVHPKSDTASL